MFLKLIFISIVIELLNWMNLRYVGYNVLKKYIKFSFMLIVQFCPNFKKKLATYLKKNISQPKLSFCEKQAVIEFTLYFSENWVVHLMVVSRNLNFEFPITI